MDSMPPKYPIGQQSFEILRKLGFLYVDKTKYIERLLEEGQYFFLSRPRRFGKSLFLTTLKAFFEGKRELFKGLYADTMDWDWEKVPVLHLDLNTQWYREDGDLEELLEIFLRQYEVEFDVESPKVSFSQRLGLLIKAIYSKTGQNVVILVDEYDKPLVNTLHDRRRFEHYRELLGALYSNFKSSAEYIRMVFMTGVSRFGKLSVFSGLNNIRDISFSDRFAAICGITEEELLTDLREGISSLAQYEGLTYEEEVSQLKKWYDGYHFSMRCPDIYNPFSLLNTFANQYYSNYWISSGTPSLLVEQLKRTNADLQRLTHTICKQSDLEGLDIDNLRLLALFYQTGYLTLKSYDPASRTFTLGLPNYEVQEGFMKYILPFYASMHSDEVSGFVERLRHDLGNGEVEDFMDQLQSFFAGVSYDLHMEEERNLQNALYILFTIMGVTTQVEYRTSNGRIDILLTTNNFVYIIELKFNRTAKEALDQIKGKRYSLPWKTGSRTVIGIGINYSSHLRNIDEWKSEILHP